MSLPFLLLPGAIGASSQMLPLKAELEKHFSDVHLFDFPGHAGKPFPAEPFSIQLFAESVLGWMNEKEFQKLNFFGYSMGGYVALWLASRHPEKVGKIFTLATKFAWDEATSQKEVKMLDPEKIREKLPDFAKALEKRHAPLDWKEVLHRTAEMMLNLGNDPGLKPKDLAAIKSPVLISVGDRDTMVSIEETAAVYRQIPGAQFAVLPVTPHPIEKVNVKMVGETANRFFTAL